MANLKYITQDGDRMFAVLSDGSKIMCYPTPAGNWIVKSSGGGPVDPEPGEGGWHHPLGAPHPWTTYDDGGGSHSAGAVDFGLGAGTEAPLIAACDGVVLRAGKEDDIAGNVVIIQPTGEQTGIVTAHMNRVDVEVGQTITGGTPIGLSGWTGYVLPPGPAGAHLHLEVRQFGVQWNPWFRAVDYFASKGIAL